MFNLSKLQSRLMTYSSVMAALLLYSTNVIATESSIVEQEVRAPEDQATELFKQADRIPLPSAITPSTVPNPLQAQHDLERNAQQAEDVDYEIGDLIEDPILFTKYLNLALAAKNVAVVNRLLPYYRSLSVNDPNLIRYADAMVFTSEGKNAQAIAIYRDMLAEDPNLNPVRLDMAMAMLRDKQYVAAENQFRRLKAEPLPEPVMRVVDNALASIDNIDEWRFNATLGYVNNDNVNDVPETRISTGFGTVASPIEAHGIEASIGARRRMNLPNNFYANFAGNTFIRGYWDESDYNDYLLTLSTGVGYDDALNDISLTPFVTRRFYDEQAYSTRAGVTLGASRWVLPKLKLSTTATLSNESFDDERNENREADGQYVGVNAFYTLDAQTYFYGGVGYYGNDVDKVGFLNYDRSSVNVGWGREWSRGFSTVTNVSYADKQYDDPIDRDRPYYSGIGAPLGVAREDTTTAVSLQVWKRDWNWLGLTPRLLMSYDMTDSNFEFYDRENRAEATIQLTKSF